ncbi:MAG: hypothetical protein AAGH99_02575 [Planctomycetota bacterium]
MSQAGFPTELGGQANPSPNSIARLEIALREVTRRWRGAKLLGVALGGAAGLLAALLGVVLLDAALGLPAWGLVTVDLALVVLIVVVIVIFFRTAARARHAPRRAAVALEQSGNAPTGRLINALDLSDDDADSQQVSPSLRRLVIERGEDSAAQIDSRALVDREHRRRAAAAFLVAAGVFLTAWLTMPGVFGAVTPRLLAPTANLPAYTTLSFEIAVAAGNDDGVVRVGRPAVIEATLSRMWGNKPLPTEADVIVLYQNGTARKFPMHRSFRETDPPPTMASAEADDLPDVPTRFSLRFERVDQPMTFCIDTPDGRSRGYTIAPDTTPLLESLHATVTPPDYARQPSTTQRLSVNPAESSPPSVKALRGSAVTLTATSNVPLREAQLTLGSKSRARVFDNPDAQKNAEAMVVVDASADASLRLIGIDGKASEPIAVTLEAVGDRAPAVEILSPEPIAFAVEGFPVPIRVVAKDDVGVASVKLHLSAGKGEQELAPIELFNDQQPESTRRATQTHELDLEALGLEPGDTLRYFATARDSLPFALGGPPHDAGQSAETPVQQVQIISREEWEEIARTQYGIEQMQAEVEAFMAEMQALAEARAEIVEQLDALKEKLAAGEPLDDVERQQMKDLQEKLDAFAEEAAALAEAMRERAEVPALYEFEEPFQERLKDLADQLERQAELAEAMRDAAEPMADASPNGDDPQDPNAANQPGQPAQAGESQSSRPPGLSLPSVTPTQIDEFLEKAEQLAEEGEPFDEQTEEEMQDLEEDLLRLELAEEIVFHAERIRAVIVEQREIEVKLGELRFRDADQLSAEEAQRVAAYGEREFELRDELEDAALMLRESAELAGPLLPRMSGSSVALTEKLEGLYVYPDMEAVGNHAEALNVGLAHASAQLAADKLESLLSDCQAMPGQASQDLDGCLSLPKSKLQNAMQQMAQARGAAAAMGLSGGQGRGSSGFSGGGGRSPASMIGPPSMGSAPQRAGRGNTGSGRSNSPSAADGLDPELGEAETLNPESTETRGRSAIALPGVPARYQDIAAAYFQRLADEAARQDDSP